jgi:hypothetical protein
MHQHSRWSGTELQKLEESFKKWRYDHKAIKANEGFPNRTEESIRQKLLSRFPRDGPKISEQNMSALRGGKLLLT